MRRLIYMISLHFTTTHIYFLALHLHYSIPRLLEKGKPPERMGRKATGLNLDVLRYGSRVAGRYSAESAVSRTAKKRRCDILFRSNSALSVFPLFVSISHCVALFDRFCPFRSGDLGLGP